MNSAIARQRELDDTISKLTIGHAEKQKLQEQVAELLEITTPPIAGGMARLINVVVPRLGLDDPEIFERLAGQFGYVRAPSDDEVRGPLG